MAEIMIKDKTYVSVKGERERICLERKIGSVSELLETGWADDISLTGKIALKEEICFDLKKKQTQAVLKNDTGESICFKNLFYALKDAETSFFGRIIRENEVLKKSLYELFKGRMNLPFSSDKLTLSRLVEVVRFRGFEKSFYDAIPYEKGEKNPDGSFEELTEKITDIKSVEDILKKSVIPFTKANVRLFAEKQGLIFYIRECEKLFDIVENVDLFRNIMNSDSIYEILATMHTAPGVELFYRDYCAVRGKQCFSRNIVKYPIEFKMKAIMYCSASPYVREDEKKRWNNKDYFLRWMPWKFWKISYSLPSLQKSEAEDDVIDGFEFKRLCSTGECFDVGESLKNCLGERESNSFPVFVISKGGKNVAAVELFGKEVIMALGEKNCEIDRDSPLHCAIKKWCNKNGVEF